MIMVTMMTMLMITMIMIMVTMLMITMIMKMVTMMIILITVIMIMLTMMTMWMITMIMIMVTMTISVTFILKRYLNIAPISITSCIFLSHLVDFHSKETYSVYKGS